MNRVERLVGVRVRVATSDLRPGGVAEVLQGGELLAECGLQVPVALRRDGRCGARSDVAADDERGTLHTERGGGGVAGRRVAKNRTA